jgi:uncharacterized protein (TIGR02646 family)
MKYIRKNSPPTNFQKWKLKNKKERWESLTNPLKGQVRGSLMLEQGYICCYCGQEINVNTSHIEHLKPKSSYPKFRFDYNNLLASCQPESYSPMQPSHCGHKKGNLYGPYFISPLTPNCEKEFRFAGDGRIIGITKNAEKTIDILDLNVSVLRAKRKAIIDAFKNLPPEELKIIISQYSELKSDNQFYSFSFVVTGFFMDYV